MGEETEKPNKIGVVATASKKPRHRKKLLYQALKKQMEFYFSDVNISKDRFMNDLLQKSPYVDVSIFLNFNKVKNMTTKVKDIAKALRTSELLKVTEDGTKVYRTTAPQQKENSDECTIYVEQIPFDADHTWLIDIFQSYGPVDYVSIPKFKHSRRNKGFAFVEYKDAQSAKNALTAFSEIGCCLSNQMDPGNLCSIRTFEENEDEINNKKCTESFNLKEERSLPDNNFQNNSLLGFDNEGKESNDENFSDKQIIDERNSKKRKLISDTNNCSNRDCNVDNENFLEKNIRINLDTVDINADTSSKEMREEINQRKRKNSSEIVDDFGNKRVKEGKSEDTVANESSVVEENADKTCYKKGKRKYSESNLKDNSDCDGEVEGVNMEPQQDNETLQEFNKSKLSDSSPLEVDSKELHDQNEEDYGENADEDNEENADEDNEENADEDNEERRKKNRRKRKKHKKSKAADNSFGLNILSKKEWKSLRNKYLNEQRRKMKELKNYIRSKKYNNQMPDVHSSNGKFNSGGINGNNENSEGSLKSENTDILDNNQDNGVKVQISSRLTLIPGLIVKVTLTEHVLSKTAFKNETKIFPEIKYVDIREGSNIIYLRFSSTAAAEKCIQSGHWPSAEIIKDDEEKEYWDKIANEREIKLSKGRSVKRGRDKLLKKAEEMHVKHIWFD